MHKWPKDCESFVTGLPVAAFSSTSRPPRRFASAHLLGATMKQILRAAVTLAVGVGGTACSSKHGEMPAADNLLISLALSPSNVSVPQGRTVPVAVTVVRAAGFTDPVTVSAGGLPNDVSASPLIISGNSGTLNLSAAGAAAVIDNVAVAVTAASGANSATGLLTLSVTAPGFSLSLSPPVLGIGRGSTGLATVTVTRHDFAGAVAVTVSGLPGGVTADSLSISGNRGSLTLRVASTAELGPSSLTVRGVSGSTSATSPLQLQVVQPGGLDVSFGAGSPIPGMVITPFDSSDGGTSSMLRAVAIQPDGKIVVVGNRTRSSQPLCGPTMNQNCVGVVVARYNLDGTLDSNFGGTEVRDPPPRGVSIVLETDPVRAVTANAVTVSDGGILVAASGLSDTLLRFTVDGILDPTFNADAGIPGRAQLTIAGKAAAVVDEEKILVAGQTNSAPGAFALARYASDGTLDTAFGDGGVLARPFVGVTGSPSANGATFTAEKAKVAGSATISGRSGVAVMSFDITGTGSVDESFNGTGQALIQLGPISSTGNAVLDLDGGTVIVANTRDSA
ncbi:MAG TPA: hypothetical protein VKE49_10160, partial [Myxococcaceae bacterium]|nr:hypothetical protein [Myxococcaceae bacterium]